MKIEFKWKTNMKRGDDGAQVWWRIDTALQVSPLGMMLSENARIGICAWAIDFFVRDGKYISNKTAVKVYTKDFILKSPLSFMRDEACAALADVVVSALYPEPEED